MRNYQPTRNNPYLLPHNLYVEVKYMLKDYDRLREEYETLTAQQDENRNWARLCTTAARLCAMDTAISGIPPEYRKGILNNLKHEGSRDGYYPIDADFRTYQRYKQKLIFLTAQNMNYV